MRDWKEVIEEGQVFYINEEIGNIQKLSEEAYLAFMPRIIKLGPFGSLSQAQQAMEDNQAALNKLLDDFNHSLIDLIESIKRG